MLGSVIGLIRNDLRRQTDWAKEEVARQSRAVMVKAVFALVGGICLLGAAVVGLMAIYAWAEPRYGALAALGIVAGVLATCAGLSLAIAFGSKGGTPQPRPAVRSLEPEILQQALMADVTAGSDRAIGALRTSSLGPAIAAGEDVVRSGKALYGAVGNQLRGRSTPAMIATLGVAALMGMFVGRRL